MSKDDFNIVVNPINRTNTGIITNSTYLFDFSRFKMGRYELAFNFCSSAGDTQTQNPAHIFIDFGGSNQFETLSNGAYSPSTLYIGSALAYSSATTIGILKAGVGDCAPLIIQRPSNNQFTVRILQSDFATYWVDGFPNDLAGYILNLRFKKIKDE
jgi:hypothetical protein